VVTGSFEYDYANPSGVTEEGFNLQQFADHGFEQRKCRSCGSLFWTNSGAETCGDNPCDEYTLIESPPIPEAHSLEEMRESFLSYFEGHNHTRLERYPVVARWRSDIYFAIASIACFQPHVTGGLAPPPANPLAISQPSIRFNDLDSVGRSGRHLTSFEMMGHHAFNYPDHEVYWLEDTVAYCYDWFTNVLGIDRCSITFKENPWSGGGNAGPALEVMAGGVELATLVFMAYVADPEGAVEIKGETYSPMDLRVVDTGYGLERLVWASQGTPTVYDAAFPEVVGELRKACDLQLGSPGEDETARIIAENTRVAGVMDLDTSSSIEVLRAEVVKRLAGHGVDIDVPQLTELITPHEHLYALADHTRVLPWMLADGVVPSNVKAGYLARLLIRRSLRLIEQLDCPLSLVDIVDLHRPALRGTFEVDSRWDYISGILELETERYHSTIKKGKRLVAAALESSKGKELPLESLVEFWDSHGVPPAIVKQLGEERGVKVNVPDNFSTILATRHERATPEEMAEAADEAEELGEDLPPTRMLYYEAPSQTEFEAVVQWSAPGKVVLDRTLFYPEGGGQPSDEGALHVGDGTHHVRWVEKRGSVIVHHLLDEDVQVPVGEVAKGLIDVERRNAHTRHHTATHLVLAAARQVLGDHVWQSGAQKGTEMARVDISHFQRVSPEELAAIETRANELVLAAHQVDKSFVERTEAERKYGFRLYQGGVPAGEEIRVVRIADVDVEACGGTHVANTAQVGSIRMRRAERIADGIVRLEYSAGMAAVRLGQEERALLQEASEVLDVRPDQLPRTAQRFFSEWKDLGKQVQELTRQVGELKSGAGEEVAPGVRLVADLSDANMGDLINMARQAISGPGTVVVMASRIGGMVVARSADVDLDCRELLRVALEAAGGKGGGKPDFAQGGGDGDRMEDALKTAKLAIPDLLD
jgi:alanyl-tRNA synthetase